MFDSKFIALACAHLVGWPGGLYQQLVTRTSDRKEVCFRQARDVCKLVIIDQINWRGPNIIPTTKPSKSCATPSSLTYSAIIGRAILGP